VFCLMSRVKTPPPRKPGRTGKPRTGNLNENREKRRGRQLQTGRKEQIDSTAISIAREPQISQKQPRKKKERGRKEIGERERGEENEPRGTMLSIRYTSRQSHEQATKVREEGTRKGRVCRPRLNKQYKMKPVT